MNGEAPMDVAVNEDPTERAEKIKEEGNVYFKTKKYDDAIRCYTEAISAFNSVLPLSQ